MFHITYLALVHWKVSKKALFIMVVMRALAQCQETLTQLFLQDFNKKHGFSEIDKSNNNFKSKKPFFAREQRSTLASGFLIICVAVL